jgi:hypothetical protein
LSGEIGPSTELIIPGGVAFTAAYKGDDTNKSEANNKDRITKNETLLLLR